MNPSGPDVHQTLEYRTNNAIVRLLPSGLLMIFLGLFVFVLSDPAHNPVIRYVGIPLVLVVGSAVIGVALWMRVNPRKPLFTLSPAGIQYRIPWVKEFLIPWREIQGVDTISIVTQQSQFAWLFVSNVQPPFRNTMLFDNVTVVLVSKQFYDSRIFVRSFFLRGPGWKASFIPKGDLVQIALHHTLVSVEPQALRQAVEARWHAFRDQTAASDAAPSSNVVAMGDNPQAMSTWEAVKIIGLLIGIAAMLLKIAGF